MRKTDKTKALLNFFRDKKIVTLKELVEYSQCSIPTMRRRLKEWQTYTSYNQNGGYYTLFDIPQFDSYGLWQFKKARFSQQGNLKNTLVYLVDQSPAGLRATETSQLLGVPMDRFLSEHFKREAQLMREKHQGSYLYFSKHPKRYAQQKDQREKLVGSQAKQNLPSDAEAVMILVELIKHPNDTVEQLRRRVQRRGLPVSREAVRYLLLEHDLFKKTWDFRRFKRSEITLIA